MKQKFRFSLIGLLYNLCMAVLIASVVGAVEPAAALPVFGGAAVLFNLPFHTTGIKGLAFDGLRTDVWKPEIAPNFFPDNSFIAEGVNEDAFVENDYVIRPEEGDNPKVAKNRKTFPHQIEQLEDNFHTYQLDEYSSDVSRIADRDRIEFSYDYRQSVLRRHVESINANIATDLAAKWATTQADRILPTTGANRVTVAQGGTGNRKACTIQDLRKLHRVLDADDVPQMGRILVLPSAFYEDIYDELLGQFTDRIIVTEEQIREATGFERIYKRSKVVQYSSNLAAVRAVGKDGNFLSAATADRMGGIAFHRSCVGRALGTVLASVSEYREEYQGYLAGVVARAGGKPMYSAQKGLAALAEVAP